MGKIYENETKSITDNDQEMIKLERVIKINGAVPCPHTCYAYDAMGKINMDRLQSLLGDKITEVVAWYKFSQTSGFNLTMRDKIVHKQLAAISQTPLDLFTTCLLTRSASDNHSTHLFSQTFVRYSNSMYQPLPMHIVNLGDPNSSYRKPQPVSRAFKQLIDAAKINLKNHQSLKIVGELHNALQNEIESVLGSLDVVQELFKLEQEVKVLKQTLNLKTENKINATVAKQVENNNLDNGDNSAEVLNVKENCTIRKKKKTIEKLGSDGEERVLRSRGANKVCNNISYAQATQIQK